MEQRIYHYPVWLRLWHLCNALFCITLIVTGINMQYSSPDNALIPFDVAVSTHNLVGIFLSISYLIFIIGNLITKNSRFYIFKIKGFVPLIKAQISYYTKGIFIGNKAPFPVTKERKFNPIQQLSYVAVMFVMVPLLIITGWAMLFPEIIIHQIFGVSGLLLTDLLHIILGFFVSLFLVIHIYFCTTGTRFGSLFKGMINGWAEVH